jgi:type I restriction enzyme S subunit
MSWEIVKLGDVLDYEQPTNYIVSSDIYNDHFYTPVLTAGKSFILGYTNETDGVFSNLPVIIFDDFTTVSKYVDFPFKVKSSAMKILKAKEGVAVTRYMYYLLQTLNVDSDLHKRYWISTFAPLKVPLPPLPIQKRIAEILDAANALKRKDQELLKKYDELAQAIFIDMFGDPVKNEKGWEEDKIKNIASKEKHSIKAGPFGSSLKKEFYKKSGYKIYGQEQVIADNFTIGDYYIDEEKYQELKNCSIKEGDILISLVGTYGKISVVPKNIEIGIINPRLMKISLNRKLFNPHFFKYLLQTKQMYDRLSTFSRGGTMDIVNVGIISEVIVIIPPIEIQNEFVGILNLVKEQIRLISKDDESDNLFQTLIQKAFNGELVN